MHLILLASLSIFAFQLCLYQSSNTPQVYIVNKYSTLAIGIRSSLLFQAFIYIPVTLDHVKYIGEVRVKRFTWHLGRHELCKQGEVTAAQKPIYPFDLNEVLQFRSKLLVRY